MQAYLVRTRHHRILIDTCAGCGKNQPDAPDWHERSDASWLERLAAAGYAPEDIDYVFCTQLHSDHCGWNTRQRDGRWVPTFPNARHVFSKLEYQATAKLGGAAFEQSVLPVAEAGRGFGASGRSGAPCGAKLNERRNPRSAAQRVSHLDLRFPGEPDSPSAGVLQRACLGSRRGPPSTSRSEVPWGTSQCRRGAALTLSPAAILA